MALCLLRGLNTPPRPGLAGLCRSPALWPWTSLYFSGPQLPDPSDSPSHRVCGDSMAVNVVPVASKITTRSAAVCWARHQVRTRPGDPQCDVGHGERGRSFPTRAEQEPGLRGPRQLPLPRWWLPARPPSSSHSCLEETARPRTDVPFFLLPLSHTRGLGSGSAQGPHLGASASIP